MTERWQTLAIRDTNSARLWMDAYLAGFALRGGFGTRSHLGLPGRFKERRNPSAVKMK